MNPKRQPQPLDQRLTTAFVKELEKTSAAIIRKTTIDDRLPLAQVYEAHVLAAFQLLQMTIRARTMTRGKMPAPPGSSPAVRLKEREKVMHEIMALISEELAILDPVHTYHVAIMKREEQKSWPSP
jgi:hypothetical protein